MKEIVIIMKNIVLIMKNIVIILKKTILSSGANLPQTFEFGGISAISLIDNMVWSCNKKEVSRWCKLN